MRSRQEPNRRVEWKVLKAACAHVQDVVGAGVNFTSTRSSSSWSESSRADPRGFYKHLKGTVGMEGTRVKEEQYIRDEDGILLRNKGEIRSRWVRFFNTLLNQKSPKLDPIILERFPTRPVALSLGDEPTMIAMTEAIRSMANEKAAGPGSLPADLLKLDDPDLLQHFLSIM